MNAKQQAIKAAIRKAWGESIKGTDHSIDIIMECVDKYGWVHPVGLKHGFNVSQMNLEVKRMVVGIDGVRPLALKGIENNRGWTRIDGPDDLPKEPGQYIVRGKSGKIEEWWYTNYEGTILFWLDYFTHWRPVEEVPEPVY